MSNFSPINILVTGGSGFIGSNMIRYLFDQINFTGRVINLDKLTYAGSTNNLKDIEKKEFGKRYFFEKDDICNIENNIRILEEYKIDTVIHFAAESHVDRSIEGPGTFIQTNIVGTYSLLEACRSVWNKRKDVLFHHISTDEVFGSLGKDGYFTELTPYSPRSPYSASKAGSDHLVMAYFSTYDLPVTMSNCSNNYGPYQFPEKLIPVIILNLMKMKPLPVYGKGENIRDWIYVDDHNNGVWKIIKSAKRGISYNIGGENELKNIDLVKKICLEYSKIKNINVNVLYDLIKYVTDRPGHDIRYAIDCKKIQNELGWSRSVNFDEGLRKTIKWYLKNEILYEKNKSN